MGLGMGAQLCGLDETLATLLTLVWSLSSVTLHVSIKHLLDGKGLIALKRKYN